jgi:DNA mismatch endonuclease (patch repair protein)
VNRSAIMRAVKSRDTSPERTVRKLLSANGYRYRLQSKHLPGRPDIVFAGRKKAIFIHGCFWHGHLCKRGARIPKTNTIYWRNKIRRNRLRDERALKELRKAGWKVKVIWECEIARSNMAARLRRFLGPV